MEALTILIGELIFFPVIVFLFLIIDIIIILIFKGIKIILRYISKISYKTLLSKTQTPEILKFKIDNKKKYIWLNRITYIFLSFLIVTLLTLFVLNFFLFESTTHFILEKIKSRTKIAVTFSSATGNIFTGNFELKGVSLHRKNHPKCDFDLKADILNLDLSISSLIYYKTVIDSLYIKGLKGNLTRNGRAKNVKPRKSYTIRDFRLEDIDIYFLDTTKSPSISANFKVNYLKSALIRSYLFVFDILFHSNIKGSLNGIPFSFETKKIAEGRETKWCAKNVPLNLIGAYAGGYFKYISDGNIDFNVFNHWRIGKQMKIEMDWNLVLRNLKVEFPKTSFNKLNEISDYLSNYINNSQKELTLNLGLQISENSFKGSASIETIDIWMKFGKVFSKEILRMVVIDKGRIKKYSKEKFKSIIKKFRKKKSN